MAESPFISINNHFYGEFVKYYNKIRHMDAAMRYAVSGSDAGEFKKHLDQAYALYNPVDPPHTLCLFLVLTENKKKEFIKTLQEKLIEKASSYNSFGGFSSLFDTRELIRIMNFISDGFVDTSEANKLNFYPANSFDYINTPLYYSIITGRTEYFEKYIDSMLENGDELTGHMMSAINFRDTDFLKIAFRKKVPFESEIISTFCTDSEAVKYLCDNFSEYIFPDKNENDDPENNIADFIRLTVKKEDMLPFVRSIFNSSDSKRFRSLMENVPKINAIKASDIEDIFSRFYYHDEIEDFNKFKDAIRNMFDDKITFISDKGSLAVLKSFLNDVHISADITYDLSKDEFNFFSGQNKTAVRKFLKENNIIFPKDVSAHTFTGLLDYNDSTIIKIMIEKAAVNDENINDIIDYLAEHKLFNALNAVNKFGSVSIHD